MNRLSDLKVLREQLALIEERRQAELAKRPQACTAVVRSSEPHGRAELEREAVMFALTCVVEFLTCENVDASALRRLLDSYQRSGDGRKGTGSPSCSLNVLQGKIAGVVYLRSLSMGGRAGSAALWVAENLPPELRDRLFGVRGRKDIAMSKAIYGWYAQVTADDVLEDAAKDGFQGVIRLGLRPLARGRPRRDPPSLEVLKGLLLGLAAS
jgi:hypothetical protein